jgi:hypothetical protein
MGGANGRDGHHPSEWDAMMYSVFVWVLDIGVEERSPLLRGWRGVFGPQRKKRGDREAARDDFIPCITIFLVFGRG